MPLSIPRGVQKRDDAIAAAFGPSAILFVTAAQPGFFVLKPSLGASRDPVVSWALDECGCCYPVTMRAGMHNTDPAILCPDGTVRNYSDTWASLEDWLAEANATTADRGR